MLTLITFLLFTGAVAWITWLITRRDDHSSSEGYFLAGRSLTAGYIAGSLMLTNLSTEQLVGLNGAAYADGLSVMAWEVVAALALVLMALFFLPRYLKSGIATLPQFLEYRYGPTTRAITTIIFILAYAGILLPILLYTGAKGLSGMLDLTTLLGFSSEGPVIWLTVWVVGIIGSIYAIWGGLRTVAVSDTLNGFGLLVGGVMITVFGLSLVAGDSGGIFEGLRQVRDANPERFNSIGGPQQSVPFHTLFTGVLLLNLFYWTTNQQIIQRTFGASSLAQGQKGVLMAGGLKVLAPLILVLPGIIAYHLYADQGVRPDDAYGTLVRQVLPRPLTGFFAAAMVGAILSSFNSALNATATLFSYGVYQPMIRPQASPRETVRSGMWCGVAVALIAMLSAPFLLGKDSIFAYLQDMNGIYFIPIFAVLIAGMLNRRVSQAGANVGLIFALLAMALGSFVFNEAIVSRMSFFHYMGIVFAAAIGLMLIQARIWPRTEPFRQVDARLVDLTPWKHARLAGALLFAVVVAIYISFADFSVLRRGAPTEPARPVATEPAAEDLAPIPEGAPIGSGAPRG
jgi:solute:Na+ symporter, SSS family